MATPQSRQGQKKQYNRLVAKLHNDILSSEEKDDLILLSILKGNENFANTTANAATATRIRRALEETKGGAINRRQG